MPNQDRPLAKGKDQDRINTPLPLVGEPLDGRHYLDVVEEQQYSGKPFVKEEQDKALGQGESSPARPKSSQ